MAAHRVRPAPAAVLGAFETVIGQCLGLLELRRLRAVPRHPAAVSAADARAELDDALATATLDWHRRLRAGTRLRDRAG